MGLLWSLCIITFTLAKILGKHNFERKLSKRIGFGWAAFKRHNYIFRSSTPQSLKTKPLNQCVLTVVTCGAEMWTLSSGLINKFEVAQHAMERAMLRVF